MEVKFTAPVETTGGKIRGYYQEDGIMVFKGVPYAEPPIGERRFRPAERYAYREGVLDCVEFGLLQELIDECVDRTAREESNAYLTHSPHYEYWCSKHACAVELRNGFMKALSHARPKRNKERDL